MTEQDEPCKRDDLRVDAVMTVAVDDRGQPVYDVPCADPVEYQPYWCVNCDEAFSYFSEAIGHLPAVRTSDGRLARIFHASGVEDVEAGKPASVW